MHIKGYEDNAQKMVDTQQMLAMTVAITITYRLWGSCERSVGRSARAS